VRLRSIAWAALAALVVASLLRSDTLVFATLAAAALAALVVTTRRRVFRAVTFERTLSRHVVSWGGELEITMSVANAKLLPLLWMQVRDEWPLGLEPLGFALRPLVSRHAQGFAQTVSVRWFERLRRRYRVRCTQRGLHRFGPVELEAGDPFGMAGVGRALEAREDLAVLPKVLDVPGFDLLTGHPLVEEPATHSLATDPTALRGVRPYRPGDPLRTINWRASARLGALHTNEFDPTSLAAVRLLLDIGGSRYEWQAVDPELLELLCVVTGSLACAFAARGFGVGLASNVRLTRDARAVDVEPAEGALPHVLETLARVIPATARDFAPVLAAELGDEGSRADCVLVTAALRPQLCTEVARLRAVRPTRVVHVGRPSDEAAPLVDAVVPDGLDWRTSHELPLLF